MDYILLVDPADLVVVGLDTEKDPSHILYDERRIKIPLDEGLIRNIQVYGIQVPVLVWKPSDATSVFQVIDGRQRVRAARELNKRGVPVQVPVIVKEGEEAQLIGLMISSNALSQEDKPIHKAKRAERMSKMGFSRQEIADTFGISIETCEKWLRLFKFSDNLVKAVEEGRVSMREALLAESSCERRKLAQRVEARVKLGRPTGAQSSVPRRRVIRKHLRDLTARLENEDNPKLQAIVFTLGWICGEISDDFFEKVIRQRHPEKQESDVVEWWFRSVWGSGPNDVFIVSWEGAVLHYDGQVWVMQTWTNQPLIAVWGTGPNDVFAVGSGGAVLHYNGKVWDKQTSKTTKNLRAVWGSGSSDVFAVGGVILHYNGQAWEVQSNDTTDLRAMWGTGPSDVFAVGGKGVILHYDGHVWMAQKSGTTNDLHAVWGSGPNNVFVVGSSGTVLHYDGQSWAVQERVTTKRLLAIWGSGPRDVFVVGIKGTVLHYDGQAWTVRENNVTNNSLYAMWGSGSNKIFAVGESSSVLHYDGESWKKTDRRTILDRVTTTTWR